MEYRMTLGIDLGPHSIGWALIEEEKIKGPLGGEPVAFLDTGVRVFPEGLDRNKGFEKSRSAKRREARGARKIHKRRNRRKERLKTLLRDNGLLPDDEANDALMLTDPYRLRADGLDRKLTLHEFGRALYHICQRRGFKSNRKTDDPKETGVVLKDINELRDEIKVSGSRTLGEFLYRKHHKDQSKRIRGHYTHRDMYIKEFELLWVTQKAHYPEILTEELKSDIGQRTIFFQRPLKIQKDLVGKCEYEQGKKRSPRGTWYAQRFRMLQDVNNLNITETSTGEVRPLTKEERELLVLTLGQKKDMTFDAMKKKLGLTESARFNLEEGERKKLKGNAIEWELRQVFKKDYDGLSAEVRDEIIHDLNFLDSEAVLSKHASTRWGLDDKQIERLNKVRTDSGYLNLSEKAIKKLLPHLEVGCLYMDAVARAGYERRDQREVEHTPCLEAKDIPSLTNPLVRSALHQVRSVVNSIVAEYGVPDKIRVEMVRDLKRSARARKEYSKKQKDNERRNNNASERLKAEFGIACPSRDDIIKYNLWEECNNECPYTGRPIPMGALFGGDFEVEHIIPYSRSLDDSYMNKTLCYTGENRLKLDMTPWEFYGTDTVRYGEILKRIKRMPYPKRKRFEMREVDDGFIKRKLSDTAYIAREVRSYLERVAGKNKVEVATGITTAHLRQHWGLQTILNTEDKKNRADHRHHAVDAVVVALTAPGVIKRLQRMTRGQSDVRLRGFPAPWEGFRDDVKKKIAAIVVSHKVRRKVAGALHEETNYGKLAVKGDKGETFFAIRKLVSVLTSNEVKKRIGDKRIKALIVARLKERSLDPDKDSHTKKEWKEALKEPIYLPNRNGQPIPIKRVRLHIPSTTMLDLGGRWVKPGSNHHIVIYEYTDGKNKGKWDGEVVSMFEAAQRVKDKKSVINREVGPGRHFVMSLSINEMVRVKEESLWKYYRVEIVPFSKQITFRLHTAATTKDNSEQLLKYPSTLKELLPEKITVDPMGRVRRAND